MAAVTNELIYEILKAMQTSVRNEARSDRLERRLDLREVAEPQRPFDPRQ